MRGDGCGAQGWPCSKAKRHNAVRFGERQLRMAAKLEGGKRELIRWREGPEDKATWIKPAEAARRAAQAAREAVESERW